MHSLEIKPFKNYFAATIMQIAISPISKKVVLISCITNVNEVFYITVLSIDDTNHKLEIEFEEKIKVVYGPKFEVCFLDDDTFVIENIDVDKCCFYIGMFKNGKYSFKIATDDRISTKGTRYMAKLGEMSNTAYLVDDEFSVYSITRVKDGGMV